MIGLAKKSFFTLALSLVIACSVKVGNPDNDDEQEVERDPIVLQPISLTFQPLPDVDAMDIDPTLKSFLKETFVLIEVSQSTLNQLNEFFAIVNEHKLSRSGDVTLEKDGVTLRGKSWVDGDTNGLYFCSGAEKAFYITWDAKGSHIYRDLKQKLPVSGHPATDGLDADIESVVGDGTLSTSYSGIKRDAETFKDTDINMAFHYDAKQPSPDLTQFSGLYVETDEAGTIPDVVARRIVGEIDAQGNGKSLAHLDGLCGAFDESVEGLPAWCVRVEHTKDDLEVALDGLAEFWESLKTIGIPKRASLRKVEFPSDMVCPE